MDIILPAIDLKSIAPIIVLTITAIMVLLIGLCSSERAKSSYYITSFVGIAIAGALCANQFGTNSISFIRL